MTTSGTGKGSGFTLIEIMVVISIITILMTLFVAVASRGTGFTKATNTILQRVDLAAGKYKHLTGFYPPDGLDAVFKSREGTEIVSTACLYECLGRPLQVVKPRPGGLKKVERYEEPLMSQLREKELLRDPVDSSLAEIVDGWKIPMHYDRLQGEDSFSVQSTPDIHLVEPSYHPPDPRQFAGVSVKNSGVGQNPGAYDLWSHGAAQHRDPDTVEGMDEIDMLKETIGNWEPPRSD